MTAEWPSRLAVKGFKESEDCRREQEMRKNSWSGITDAGDFV